MTTPLDIPTVRTAISRFAGAVKSVDQYGIKDATAPGVVWTVPGNSAISGEWREQDGVAALARILQDFGYEINLVELTFGVETAAVEIRGTGTHNGKSIDVAVVNLLTFSDDKVISVLTHFSDIAAVTPTFPDHSTGRGDV